MPQLRQNIITGEWVLVAPERAKRPHDFIVTPDTAPPKTEAADCPFCVDSPSYQTRYADFDTKHTFTIPNKFPAFVAEGQHEVRSYTPEEGFYLAKPATGGHDIVIVNQHDLRLTDFSQEIMVDLLTTFQRRNQFYRNDPNVQYVMPIYNHGEAAGASIKHPHAQIFASSVIPNQVLAEKHGSEHYYEINGRCVFCEMIDHEKSEGVRVLAENDQAILFTFFAARFPFEMWLLPKAHQSIYESTDAPEIEGLATILRQAFQMLDKTLNDPPFNFFIHSLPTTSYHDDYYHWHMEIAPRLSKYGGYEIGGGTVIDVVSPEQAAKFLLYPEKAPSS